MRSRPHEPNDGLPYPPLGTTTHDLIMNSQLHHHPQPPAVHPIRLSPSPFKSQAHCYDHHSGKVERLKQVLVSGTATVLARGPQAQQVVNLLSLDRVL